jgi:hypothetical protein
MLSFRFVHHNELEWDLLFEKNVDGSLAESLWCTEEFQHHRANNVGKDRKVQRGRLSGLEQRYVLIRKALQLSLVKVDRHRMPSLSMIGVLTQ